MILVIFCLLRSIFKGISHLTFYFCNNSSIGWAVSSFFIFRFIISFYVKAFECFIFALASAPYHTIPSVYHRSILHLSPIYQAPTGPALWLGPVEPPPPPTHVISVARISVYFFNGLFCVDWKGVGFGADRGSGSFFSRDYLRPRDFSHFSHRDSLY